MEEYDPTQELLFTLEQTMGKEAADWFKTELDKDPEQDPMKLLRRLEKKWAEDGKFDHLKELSEIQIGVRGGSVLANSDGRPAAPPVCECCGMTCFAYHPCEKWVEAHPHPHGSDLTKQQLFRLFKFVKEKGFIGLKTMAEIMECKQKDIGPWE